MKLVTPVREFFFPDATGYTSDDGRNLPVKDVKYYIGGEFLLPDDLADYFLKKNLVTLIEPLAKHPAPPTRGKK